MNIYNKPKTNFDQWPQFYIATIERDGLSYVKFGKTNEASTRFSRYSNGLAGTKITFESTYDFIEAQWMTDKIHLNWEQYIHRKLAETGNKVKPHFHFSGDNECYNLPITIVVEIVERTINELIDQHVTKAQYKAWNEAIANIINEKTN